MNWFIFWVGMWFCADGLGSSAISVLTGEKRFHSWLQVGRGVRCGLGVVLMFLAMVE